MKNTITHKFTKVVAAILFTFFFAGSVSANGYYFYVQLTDKKNSPYSLTQPTDFLSARAIARRVAFQLPIDSTDIPVNPAYIQGVEATGVKVFRTTRWLNGLTIIAADSSVMSAVRALPYVKRVQYTGLANNNPPLVGRQKFPRANEAFDYGSATTQINQVNGAYMHDQGYTGAGIHVGVLDAGFYNVNINPGFETLRSQGRLLGTKNIAGSADVYTLHSHGANVLSIMTGNLPSQYLGAAPDASFWLIRTEVDPSEYLVEVDFWVSGIEFADSVGVDVVNSSLGYTEFDDPAMNFTYNDMNGTVSRASIAARMAAEKGIIVCNSAGNSGNTVWKYIGSPADADKILTVGAVTSTGAAASFSSYGPASDSRIKPEVSAMGSGTALIGTTGTVTWGSGTSYSSPIIAGMMACYLQYVKANRTRYYIDDILQSVIASSNLYGYPHPQLGYGIPNFQVAMATLPTYSNVYELKSKDLRIYHDNSNKILRLSLVNDSYIDGQIIVYNIAGQMCATKDISYKEMKLDVNHLQSGVYVVTVRKNGIRESQKIIIK
jgi:hypothetical protein